MTSPLRQTYRQYKRRFRQAILTAAFERALVRKVGDHWIMVKDLDDRSLVIDLGANQGAFCKHMGQLFQCKAYAIEANPELFNNLLRSQIEAFNCAVTSSNGQVDFYISDNLEASSVLPEFQAMWGVTKHISVEGLDFSTLLQRLELTSTTIDVVKVDIEGSELDVIHSLSGTDVAHIKQMTIEFHDWLNKDLRTGTIAAIQKLVSLGFEAYTDAPHHNVAVEMLFLNRKLLKLNLMQRLNLWMFIRFAFLNYNK
jgi:FkbM family methyltransferase